MVLSGTAPLLSAAGQPVWLIVAQAVAVTITVAVPLFEGGVIAVDSGFRWWLLLAGGLALLGPTLAIQGDEGPIERLTRKVRRATADEDVDFDVGREDEIGALAEAIDDLAASRTAPEEEDSMVERYRREFHEITAARDLDVDEKIDRLLELGSERLGVENGLITAIDVESGRYEVERAAGSDFVVAGTVTELLETFCRKTIETDEDVLAIFNAPEEGYVNDPGYRRWNIGCYLGAKVIVDDRLYGTLCFVNEQPRERPFSADEKVFVDLMGRWISHALERRKHLERLNLANRGMDAAPIGITVTDPQQDDNPIVRTNPAFTAITGYDEAEVVGRNCRFLQGEDTDAKSVAAMRRAIDRHEPVTVELKNYRNDGTEFWNRVSIAPVVDGEGKLTNFVGFQADVTDRKERECQLERERDRFAALFDNLPTPVYRAVAKDGKPGVREVNAAFEETFGYDAEDLRGENVHDLIATETESDLAAPNRDVLDEAGLPTEVVRETVDGERVFQLNVGLREREDGRPEGYAIYTDVTERKEKAQALERQRAYTEDLLDAIDDVFYVLDESGAFRRWNRSFRELTGYGDEEIAGMHALEFFPPAARPAVTDAIQEVFESGTGRVEASILPKDGETVPYEFVAAKVEDPEGEPVLTGIGRDVTERRRRERELRERERELEGYREYTEDVLDAIDDVLYIVDADYRLQRWNESLAAVTGYDDDALAGMPVGEFFDETDARRIRSALDDIDRRVGQPLEATVRTADGEAIPYEFVAAPLTDPEDERAIAGIGRDISARKRYETELERTTDMLQQAGRLAKFGGWELDLTEPSREMIWTEELYDIHDVPATGTIDVETALQLYHPGDRELIEERIERAIETGHGYDMEVRALTTDGEIRWVRALGEAVEDENGTVVKLRGAIQDITEQKEREFALQSLHESTQGLLNADAPSDVARVVADAAEAALDVAGVGIFLYDEDANRLEPAAVTERLADAVGQSVDAIGPQDESLLWHAFVTDSSTLIGGVDTDGGGIEGTIDHGLVMPIGAHGVLLAGAERGSTDASTRRLVETLVASGAAALDRIANEAALRDRDAELEARNERLRRQVRITETIRSVDRTLIGATSQTDVETGVCEQLAAGQDVALAWIGGFDDGGKSVVPRAWAGDANGYLDSDVFSRAADAPEPGVATAVDREPTVVENVARNVQSEPWRREALAAEFQSVLAVPIALEEYHYGVLAVYAAEPRTFGDLERNVFAELGESIANAITAVSTRRALHAESVIALTLRLEGTTDPLVGIAAAADSEVRFEGVASLSSDEARLFVRTHGVATGKVADALADRHSVSDYRLVRETDDGDVFEVTLGTGSLVEKLVQHGANPRSITADVTGLDVVVEVPTGSDVRAFVEMLEEDFAVELRSRREVSRSLQTRQGVIETLLDELTKRQREVLRTAYLAGFFNWPRDTTGEELAAMLDVSQPTVNRHLRLAEQRIVRQLFAGESAAN